MLEVQALRDPDLAEKVARLRSPEAWPNPPQSIEVIETHFAWVFLSSDTVYKLKKPARFPDFDQTTIEARRAMCELEIALNRRLAAATYIGVVPLGRQQSGLRLECETRPVDWLVKMHRLPASSNLENLLPELDSDDPRLGLLLSVLCAFYRRTARAPWSALEYPRILGSQCSSASSRLTIDELEPEHDRIRALTARQVEFADTHRGLLADRVVNGRVCDAHGDLRPEHIFLTEQPQIIDCLEFSAALRQLDTAEEIAFLALECERRGRADIGASLIGHYLEACSDTVSPALLYFYRSRRALVRAFLSAWHLEDGLRRTEAMPWLRQARWYIDQAESGIDEAWQRSRG